MKQLIKRVFVANVEELPEKLGRTVHIGDWELAIFKLSNGRIKAIENRCPHKGGVLAEGMVSGDSVFCPMHDWKINVTDGQVQGHDSGCVKTFKVEVENEKVYVLLPE
ncbi:nitrite reductase small subunit NirD [Halobacillus sp. Marseille-Q1614]|uniref:nitrite reductase small subunit NirD n=1 Tax=Halobacillus sp. Marseille-Q1614 TaxID=2709134 RepID=UPI00156FF3BD|nr:nitrite reductase small subunit NirD [Halobacillus sp. Marseille-Q1614]